jgi:HlyD family secretion protein
MTKTTRIVLGLLAAGAAVGVYFSQREADELVLTGMVTTDDVVVSSQLSGQLQKLLVREGDHVERDQLLAVLSDAELSAEHAFFVSTEQGAQSGMAESEAALRYQERLAAQQIREAEASLAATLAQQKEADASAQQTQRALTRAEAVSRSGGMSEQDVERARTDYSVAKARAEAGAKQVEAQRATVALAQSADRRRPRGAFGRGRRRRPADLDARRSRRLLGAC